MLNKKVTITRNYTLEVPEKRQQIQFSNLNNQK